MTYLLHIAERVLNRPLAITQDKIQIILSVLNGRIGLNAPLAEQEFGGGSLKQGPAYRIVNGVPVISVQGSLVNRGSFLDSQSGLCSYDSIIEQCAQAAKEPGATVIFDINTPGGEAIGCFECANAIRELTAQKQTIAIVNGMACSGGYAIASACTEIVTSETGVSGSIGVIMVHADCSQQMENEGIKPTFIFKGAHKADGNSFEPLSDPVKADLQAEVDTYYELFVKSVAKGRGARLNTEKTRATQARTYIGQAAVDAGLADRIGTLQSVLKDVTRAARRTNHPTLKGTKMDDNSGVPAASNEAGYTKVQLDAAVAKATADGAKASTARLNAVLSHEGISGNAARMKAATDLAASTEMSAEQVVAFATAHVSDATPKAIAALASREKHEPINGVAAQQSNAAAGWAAHAAKHNATVQ